MIKEFVRLGFGLLFLSFHRQIADYVLKKERALVAAFRQRGVPMPAVPGTETGRNIYFCIGAFAVFFQIARIWLTLHD